MNTVNQNLQLILDKFTSEIKPKQFKFYNLVTEYDEENQCGTVCCVLGWFPKLFPNSGFYWIKKNIAWKTVWEINHKSEYDIKALKMLINTDNDELIHYLFYGQSCNFDLKGKPELTLKSSYKNVVKAWKYVIKHYKEENEFKYSLS